MRVCTFSSPPYPFLVSPFSLVDMQICMNLNKVSRNPSMLYAAGNRVTWVHMYFSTDGRRGQKRPKTHEWDAMGWCDGTDINPVLSKVISLDLLFLSFFLSFPVFISSFAV